jgi:hypothetical protein
MPSDRVRDILPPDTASTWDTIAPIVPPDAYLGGGTAIAVHLGHRISLSTLSRRSTTSCWASAISTMSTPTMPCPFRDPKSSITGLAGSPRSLRDAAVYPVGVDDELMYD